MRGNGTGRWQEKQNPRPAYRAEASFSKGEGRKLFFFRHGAAGFIDDPLDALCDAVGQADIAHGVFAAQEVVLLGSQTVVGQGFIADILIALEEFAKGVGKFVIIVETGNDGRTYLDMQVGELGDQLLEVAEDELVADGAFRCPSA